VQEQQDEIDSQAQQIAALKARLDALEGTASNPTGPSGFLTKLGDLWWGALVVGALVLAGRRSWGNRS
jgi:hypothetical protein